MEQARSSPVLQSLSKYDWLERLWAWKTSELEAHGDPAAVLEHHMPTTAHKLEWATRLDDKFPANPKETYINSWEAGIQAVRPWMLSWHPQSGNRGFIYQENLQNLMVLMIANGFESDCSRPGVSVPVITQPNRAYFTEAEFNFPSLHDDMAPVGGVHHIKNYMRAVTMHFTLYGMFSIGVLDMFIAANVTTVNESFATIYANYVVYDNAAKELDVSRGLSLVFYVVCVCACLCVCCVCACACV
jgi:hypothetical protein